MKIPFITTSCLWDLRASLLLIPAWWFLGVDQFIWPLLSSWIALKWALSGQRFRTEIIIVVGLISCIPILISLTAISEGYRYLTYFRNSLIYFGGLLTVVMIYSTHRSLDEVLDTIKVVVALGMILMLSGFAAAKGFDLTFKAPLGAIIPAGVNSDYIAVMVNKSLTSREATWFAAGHFRPKGLMLFTNLLAGVLLLMWPLKALLLTRSSTTVALLLLATLLVDAFVLIQTLSRSAWVAGTLALITAVILWRKTVIGKIGALFVGVVLALGFVVSGQLDTVMNRFDKAHSDKDRGENYALIMESVMSDPRHLIIGYGTQRDVIGMNIPLGSHSTYLGVLYKYGLLGLTAFSALIIVIFLQLFAAIRSAKGQHERAIVVAILGAIMVPTLQGLFIELDVDVQYFQLWWVLVGLAAATSSAILTRSPQPGSPPMRTTSPASLPHVI